MENHSFDNSGQNELEYENSNMSEELDSNGQGPGKTQGTGTITFRRIRAWSRFRRREVNVGIGCVLILISFLFPLASNGAWTATIYKIREAILAGDSGHLILAAALLCLLCAVQDSLQFLGTILLVDNMKIFNGMGKIKSILLTGGMVLVLHSAAHHMFDMPLEIVIVLMAAAISMLVYDRQLQRSGFIPIAVISTQIFFALQWLMIMPMFTQYKIGQSDIPMSIKLAAQYLDANAVLNFTGFSFFLPFLFSASVTTILFISYAQNIRVMRENYEKESQIKNMKAKILENRIYKEVKSIIHDLKTPLVTIRGLNSLLVITKDEEKIQEYTDRIESSVVRMNDMISSFLFDSMRQKVKASELIGFVRAQLPVDDDTIRTEFITDELLPDLHINKVRVARAVINILENAIIVPTKAPFKHILVESRAVEKGLVIKIHDNGVGIKPEDLDRIWEVGYSSNNTSGLGLPFAKQIIEDNDGWIVLESIPDKGTVVSLFLPCETPVAEKNHIQ